MQDLDEVLNSEKTEELSSNYLENPTDIELDDRQEPLDDESLHCPYGDEQSERDYYKSDECDSVSEESQTEHTIIPEDFGKQYSNDVLNDREEVHDNHSSIKAAIAVLCFILLAFGVIQTYNTIKHSRAERELKEELVELQARLDRIQTLQILPPSDDSNGSETVIMQVPSISGTVSKLMPSVVAVTDKLEMQKYSSGFNFFPFFQETEPTVEEGESNGSGVIIGEDDDYYYIVTNNHVVDNSGTYTEYNVESLGVVVTFNDGETCDAEVKSADETSDIAVLTVKKSDMKEETKKSISVAELGESEKMHVGDYVIAIGNALGYGQSTTYGIVSALNRAIDYQGATRYLLQTDAAINAGNSGGGLFDLNGKLIGINSAKYSTSSFNSASIEGMGFAIPIEQIRDLLVDMMTTDSYEVSNGFEKGKAYLGIKVGNASDYVEGIDGAYIVSVVSGSPAEEAGLSNGMIIIKIDDKDIQTSEELSTYITERKAGDTVHVTVMTMYNGMRFTSEISITLKVLKE